MEVLISGPTGVGKELYAHYLHEHSPRHKAPFVPINCGALPNDLFENDLFGHVGGAFTGARPHSEGLVAEAEHGTLFLDEVDSLSICLQLDRSVTPDDLLLLPAEDDEPLAPVEVVMTERSFQEAKCSLVSNFERKYLETALRQSGDNIAQATRASGKPRRAFFELMRRYGVLEADYRSTPVSLDEYVMDRANMERD